MCVLAKIRAYLRGGATWREILLFFGVKTSLHEDSCFTAKIKINYSISNLVHHLLSRTNQLSLGVRLQEKGTLDIGAVRAFFLK